MRTRSRLPFPTAVICLLTSVVTVRTALAQTVAPVTLTGVVLADDRTPLSDAVLGLERGGQTLYRARSLSDGHFTFTDVPGGMAAITIRRLGYLQRRLEFDLNAATTKEPFEILLTPVATDVEAVTIEGASGRLQGFNDRRVRNNFGYFFDQNDIRRKGPRYVSELFRTIPGARLQASRRAGNVLELRNCTPRIWIDGVRADGAEIDELISPSEIAGLEIYPSFAGVPAEYMDKENRACGVVLVWTRQT
ncbi:MAG TPA: carboxypeptidase-like regulatory domain-containing protein [Gemmatimonadaceae bacterium]|nr:carboxypeptidase-like regulatory domain-containing protein [Gemmatimonadaceae bacterium]